MLDFDSDLDRKITTTQPQKVTITPRVVEEVRVVAANGATAYLAKRDEDWNWSDLRDYITAEIEKRHGEQVRDPRKEASICKGFISRWTTEVAVAIARAAFDVHDGMWRNAPVSINRFSKNSDPFFASLIADNF